MRLDWNQLTRDQQRIVLDIRKNGPDCAKFLCRRNKMDQGAVMELLKGLEAQGWLSRVKGTFLFKRGFKRPKHMNHTYYDLSRSAEITLRTLARKGKI